MKWMSVLQVTRSAVAILMFAGLAAASTRARAELVLASGASSPAAPAPAPPNATAPVATVTGYRSARFGMTEAEVRVAIATDFGREATVKAQDQIGELTHVLTVKVPDLIPQGGQAEIRYILGYRSRRLVQVGVVWSTATDPALTPERLVANAQLLVAYFESAGYKPDTVATNLVIGDGMMMFRGEDQQGRQTQVTLRGIIAGTKEQRTFTPRLLGVFYFADPKHPDVFRIQPGQF